jgi:predicted thioesterase
VVGQAQYDLGAAVEAALDVGVDLVGVRVRIRVRVRVRVGVRVRVRVRVRVSGRRGSGCRFSEGVA